MPANATEPERVCSVCGEENAKYVVPVVMTSGLQVQMWFCETHLKEFMKTDKVN